MIFRARQHEWRFPRPALVMGIVNVTPDSFSDGGQFPDAESAIAGAMRLVAAGADLVDIGGESTRPGSAPVAEAEELRRVLPVIEGLAGRAGVPLSIDTMKPGVAERALAAGASVVNDVGANRVDPAMWRTVAAAEAGYVCMHMQGTPPTMQQDPRYEDVVREIGEFFEERLRRLAEWGVRAEQVLLDPGIGFGKTLAHNLQLLAGLGSFRKLDRPLMIGVSRKSFMGKLLGAEARERLPAGLACACLAVEAGVAVIRTHDVAETRQAIRMAEAIVAERRISCGN